MTNFRGTYINKITVKDIYGVNDFESLEGYEFTGEFRPPKKDEISANYIDPTLAHHAFKDAASNQPRLILRKISKPSYKFTYVRTGVPNAGEYVVSNGSLNSFVKATELYECTYDIYKLEEITEK